MKKLLLICGGIILTVIIVLVIIVIQFVKASEKITTGTPIPNYRVEKSVLMVIDIQECTTGKHSTTHTYQNQSSNLFFRVNALVDSANNKNIPVVYIKNEITHPVINMLDNSMEKGSDRADFDNRLEIVSENIFSKDKQDAFSNPALDEYLLQEKINKIYITGLDAGYCVKSTVLAALNREYDIILIEDAIISESEILKKDSFNQMKSLGAELIRAEEF